MGVLLPGSFRITLQLGLQVGGERWFQDKVTHERVIHTSDEHRETRRSKFKILTLIKIVSYDAEIKPPSTFEIKSSTHQVEGTFINVVPKQLGSESATPLDRVVEISEDTVRTGGWYPSDDSKLGMA